MDMNKVLDAMEYLEDHLTFEEICKTFRELMYKQVSYWCEEDKGKIYDVSYSQTNIEQATRIQQKLSTCVDLYEQVVNRHREFEEDYLKTKGI